MPMGKTFTLFYLYDNLNKDKVSSEKFFDLQFKDFTDVQKILNLGKLKAPDKIVNKIIDFTRFEEF